MTVVGSKEDGFVFDDGGLREWTHGLIARVATIHRLKIEGGVTRGLVYPGKNKKRNTAMVATVLEKRDKWLTRYLESTHIWSELLEFVAESIWTFDEDQRFKPGLRALLRQGTKEIKDWVAQVGHVRTGLLRRSTSYRAKNLSKVK